MKLLPLVSALLLCASAAAIPIEDARPVRDAGQGQLVRRAKGGHDGPEHEPGSGPPTDTDPIPGGASPDEGDLSDDTARDRQAWALWGTDKNDITKANNKLAQNSAPREGVPFQSAARLSDKFVEDDPENSRTGDNCYWIGNDPDGTPVFEGYYGAKAGGGGGHGIHVELQEAFGGRTWTKGREFSKATKKQKEDQGKIATDTSRILNAADKAAKRKKWRSEDSTFDEKNPKSLIPLAQFLPGARTVVELPDEEGSKWESPLLERASDFLANNPNGVVRLYNNVKPSQIDMKLGRPVVAPVRYFRFRGYEMEAARVLDTSGGQWTFAQATDDIQPSLLHPAAGSSKMRKRSTNLDDLSELIQELVFKRQTAALMPQATSTQQAAAPTSVANMNQTQLLATDVEIFSAIQQNITNLIWPTLEALMTGSDHPEFYMMALSIFSDMTYGPLMQDGPCAYGMSNYYDAVDQTPEGMLSASIFTYMYDQAWQNATKVVQEAGLDVLLQQFSNYTMVNDTSLLPPPPTNWNQTQSDVLDDFLPSNWSNATYQTQQRLLLNNITTAVVSTPNVTAILAPLLNATDTASNITSNSTTNGTIARRLR